MAITRLSLAVGNLVEIAGILFALIPNCVGSCDCPRSPEADYVLGCSSDWYRFNMAASIWGIVNKL